MTPSSPFSGFDFSLIDRLIFHPRPDFSSPAPAGAEDHAFPVAPEVNLSSRFYLADPKGPDLLFFHGNGEIASDYDDLGPCFNRWGISLLVADYRGYGRSGGRRPSAPCCRTPWPCSIRCRNGAQSKHGPDPS